MDHFARPEDELAISQRERTLYRNFQGYSTHAECDLVGIGVTSIGMVGRSYGQNYKSIDEYYQAIDSGHLPVFRGVELNDDDVLRRDVITRLICHFELTPAEIEREYGIDFGSYFNVEIKGLKVMAHDGLLEITDDTIRVMPRGRLLIRNICMEFDHYLRKAAPQRFSKVI